MDRNVKLLLTVYINTSLSKQMEEISYFNKVRILSWSVIKFFWLHFTKMLETHHETYYLELEKGWIIYLLVPQGLGSQLSVCEPLGYHIAFQAFEPW